MSRPTDRPSHRRGDADTSQAGYTAHLQNLESSWWKRLVDVQAPYRWNMRRLNLGFTLDVGCGVGRNLANLGGNGVGVDHNAESVATARSRGFTAFTVDEFEASEYAKPGRFDALLLSHVAEHMQEPEAVQLLSSYVGYVKPGGRVVIICPQEAGFRIESSHVCFLDIPKMNGLLTAVGARPERGFSFPFPRFAGRAFRYNEFVVVGTLTA